MEVTRQFGWTGSWRLPFSFKGRGGDGIDEGRQRGRKGLVRREGNSKKSHSWKEGGRGGRKENQKNKKNQSWKKKVQVEVGSGQDSRQQVLGGTRSSV